MNIPRATYRLQFHRDFTLEDARQVLPYLRDLGINHVYASPLLKAQPGSTHGYDVCDPTQINPEIGSEAGLEEWVRQLRQSGMGLVLDIVPNHMGIGRTNPWWWDVLKHGRESQFASTFDIDWNNPNPLLLGKLLVPVLGDSYEQVLQRKELQLALDQGEVVLRYFDQAFPVNPDSVQVPRKSPEPWLSDFNSDTAALDELIEAQHYRLVDWRQGDALLNYRRFFTIVSLAGVRAEDPKVFCDTHQLVLQWYRRGWIDGLRIDHPDGLRDPEEYLQRLHQTAPDAWTVIEKILQPTEELPAGWPIAGTSGYEFLNSVLRIFVDPAAEHPLTQGYAEFVGESPSFIEIVREKKRLILRTHLIAEVARLAGLAEAAAIDRGVQSEFAREILQEALIDLIACFPVYRTYVRSPYGKVTESDMAYVDQAICAARQSRADLGDSVFQFIHDLVLLRTSTADSTEFVMRFQQLTGPAMAKGAEDTAFFTYNRFLALNEVGGDPARFGGEVADFYDFCARQQRHWPNAMLATSTHDTKRGEDNRARLALLSEIPKEWFAAVRRWSSMTEPYRIRGWPDRNAEYHFYQTLVGAWPLSIKRAWAYMEKAAREAKAHTSWNSPNPDYEAALKGFVTGALQDSAFIRDVATFVSGLLVPGYCTALAQTLLKLAAPGVPDFYQGTELWDFSLVDPDNRRPVDFVERRQALADLQQTLVSSSPRDVAIQLLKSPEDGRIKLFLIRQVLEFRRARSELFRSGRLLPVPVTGGQANHLCAFARIGAGSAMIVVAPRLVLSLDPKARRAPVGAAVWADTALDLSQLDLGQAFRNVITGESLAIPNPPSSDCLLLAHVLAHFPVALLERVESPGPCPPP